MISEDFPLFRLPATPTCWDLHTPYFITLPRYEAPQDSAKGASPPLEPLLTAWPGNPAGQFDLWSVASRGWSLPRVPPEGVLDRVARSLRRIPCDWTGGTA